MLFVLANTSHNRKVVMRENGLGLDLEEIPRQI